MKTRYDINETIYLPFRINEIGVNSLGEVTYMIVGAAPFIIYRQSGVDQKDLDMYSLSFRKQEQNEESN